MSFSNPPRPPHIRFRWRGWDRFHTGAAPDSSDEEPGAASASRQDDDADSDPEDYWERDRAEYIARLAGLELHRRSFTRELETGSEIKLRVENRNGRIAIRTHDRPVVVVNVAAELYAGSSSEADADFERVKAGITQDGNRASVIAPELPRPEWFFFGRGPKIDYEVTVPADAEVWVSSRNGPVELSSTRRRARVESRNGRVTIEGVEGEIEVESRNGRVSLKRCSGPARVAGINGPITLEQVRGAIEAETKNGPLELIEAGASVKATTVNGPIRFTGRVAGDLEFQAVNGSVRLAVTADSRFEIDAESRHGGTTSELPVRDRKPVEGSGPAPKVRIRTVNGGIRLTEI